MTPSPQTDLLRRLFDEAVRVADPMLCVPAALPEKPKGRVLVVGAGKASARMAEAVESVWGPCEGLVITRYGYGRPTQGIEIVEAAHPVPDHAGQIATNRLLDLLATADENTFVLSLISGGGSALLISPAGDLSLDDKQALTSDLLASGAPIGAMNIVRKHLSRVKGGQMAAASHPAHMLSLMISDIPGDDPALIASGPTVGDDSTQAQALDLLDRYDVQPSAKVAAVLNGQTGVVRTDDPRLSRCENRIIAAPSQSLAAAGKIAQSQGYDVQILGDAIEGEARDLAVSHAKLALELQAGLAESAKGVVLLSGGECTVTRRGDGIGGPNAEYCLALANALDGAAGIWGLACDTDGVDGAAEVAGAIVSPDTLTIAQQVGAGITKALATNDSHGFFKTVDAQVVPGPTLTNVNDFRAVLVTPKPV